MSDQLREKRLRRMVRELNKERKLRAKKIDILCNDIIGTQRSFIRNFESVNFAANFYESIIGARELESLLHSVCATIKEQIDDSTIAFFLKSNNKFSMHLFEDTATQEKSFENYFTQEVMENISQSNELCTFERMLEMGLEVNPNLSKKISATAIPLCRNGCSSGFILIYRKADRKISKTHLENISMIIPGLTSAILACQMQLQH